MKRKREYLDMALFKKAVDEFIEMGGSKIDLNPCIGETLLDTCLMERLKYIKQYSQIESLGFFTNLQLLHKFDFKEFLDSGINWLIISTMFLGKEKYAEFFGVDNYAQTINNIVDLIRRNNEHGNKIKLQFSLKFGSEPVKSTINNADFKMVDALLSGALSKEILNTGMAVHDFCGQIKLPKYLIKRPLYPRFFRPCDFLYKVIKLFSNGKIGVCVCSDFETTSELTLGDIRGDSLNDIWNGQKLAQLRSRWRKYNIVPSLCRSCRTYSY